jgi:hypothetical protein
MQPYDVDKIMGRLNLNLQDDNDGRIGPWQDFDSLTIEHGSVVIYRRGSISIYPLSECGNITIHPRKPK